MDEKATRTATGTAFWTDPQAATDWAAGDTQRDLLSLPRRIAAEIVALDRPDTRRVVDIGSGPGDFLAVFLDRLPDAHAIWSDISETMRSLAQDRLAGFAERIEWRLADMSELSGLPTGLDVIMTSRAVHHLGREEVRRFYRDARAHLAPGGWLINLDHTGAVDDTWNTRLRNARRHLIPRNGNQQAGHRHDKPIIPVGDHLTALGDAGFADADIAWRGFVTCLFMARRND